MTVREALALKVKLQEKIKVYETIDTYLDSFISKDNREPENYILFGEDVYVSEDAIVETRGKIYELQKIEESTLTELENKEVN
jgi:hypothetical protein